MEDEVVRVRVSEPGFAGSKSIKLYGRKAEIEIEVGSSYRTSRTVHRFTVDLTPEAQTEPTGELRAVGEGR